MLDKYIIIQNEKIEELEKKRINNDLLRKSFEQIKKEYEEYKIVAKPSFLVRILKPSTVNEYEQSILEYNSLKQEYEKRKKIIDQLETDVQLSEEIENIRKTKEEAISDIKIVIKYYIENNLPIILTESDKKHSIKEIGESIANEIGAQRREIEKLEDVMLVHKTNFVPNNEEIGTRFSSNVVDVAHVTICGKQYDINLRPRRDSVHFAVNHEVTPNNGGNWNDCKYAVIVPLLSIPKEKFVSNKSVDTFTNGKVKLTENSYILCPKDAIDEVKKKNPNITVVGYEGDRVSDYGNVLLWMLGYSVEIGNDWGFTDCQKQEKYTKMILGAGYSSTAAHSATKTKEIETKNFYVSYIIGVLELVQNTPEMHNIDSQIIIEDSKIEEYLDYCDSDTYKLFNYYLSEIGLEPNYPSEGISDEHYIDYCKLLIDSAKELGKKQSKKHYDK